MLKKLGGIWDRSKKRWYTTQENDNHQILIDIYHYNNFKQGILKLNCKTKQETIDFFKMILEPHLFDIYQSNFLA